MTEATQLNGIGQIAITVDDLPSAVAFFRDSLELPLLFEVPEPPMAFFDCAGTRLMLGHAEEGQAPSKPLLYFRVGDIDATIAKLRARGVDILAEPHAVHRTETHELSIGFFRGPEDAPLALMCERPLVDAL